MNKQELNRFIDKISPTGPGGIEKIKRVLKSVLDKEGEEGVTEEELLEALAAKQDTLVSGTNIKTVNNTSLLGSGNIAIPKGDKGDKGDTGPQGPQGPQGLKGDTGVSADYPITIYNGLDSDATDQALAAAQGKVLDRKVSQLEQDVTDLDEQINGESAVSFDPQTVDSVVCYIASNNNWLVNNANQKGRIIPVSDYRGRTLQIKANATDNTFYAFVTAAPVGGTSVAYSSGTSRVQMASGQLDSVTIPNDAAYFWYSKTSYAHTFTPQSIIVTGADGIAQRFDAVENDVEEIKEQLSKSTTTKLIFENGGIGDDGLNNPSKKENNFFRCFRTGNYFRATKLFYTPGNDEVASVFTYTGDKTFIEKKTLTGDFTPDANVVFMKVQVLYEDTSNVVNIAISQGGLDNNGDEEVSTNWVRTGYIDIDSPSFDSVWYIGKVKGRIYDASYNILSVDSSFARFHNLYGGLSKFRDFLDLLSSTTFFSIRGTAKYIRLAFATNPETSITPSTYDVRFTSGDVARHTPNISAENYQEGLNGYISASTISFAFKFSAGANGQQVSQSEAATAPPLYDNRDYMSSGVLLLPPNYSEKGKPVPLILYIHGSGDYGYLGWDVMSQYYMDYLAYWQKEGFAVADFFARTSKYAAIGGDINGMPTNLSAYEQGYKWLIEHYNIDRTGCFVTGKSMGGVGALMICYSKSIPVKAADILAPALNPFYQQCGYGILSREDYITDLRLDNADALIEDPSPSAPMSQTDFNDLMIANRDKLVGYNAYLSKVPNKTWAELVALKFKNPGTFDDVIKFCEVPLRIHIAEDDMTVAYQQSLNLIKALKNSGSIAEIRTMPANTGQHHAVDNSPDALKVASIVTELGYTCTDVPLAYVEVANWFKFYR